MVLARLLNEIYPLVKFEVDISNTFGDMLRTKMWDGRTDGMTDGDYYHIPRRLFVGDKKIKICLTSPVQQIFKFSS